MSSAEAKSVASSSARGTEERGGSAVTGSNSHSSSSHSSSLHPQQQHRHRPNTDSDTASSNTFPRPNEPSMTATGRSSSPLDLLMSGPHPTLNSNSLPHAAAHAHAAPDVRDTVEYQAAWDLELWKAVQADRFRKQLEKQKSVAFADLEKTVRRREKAWRAELQQRTQAVAQREEAAKAEEARLAQRQAKVVEMEKNIRHMRQQLLEAQQRVEDEVRAQVRLANDTIAHRARLLEERVKAAEAQAKRADERQRQAQQEYLTLYEAFSHYRTQQLTSAAANSGAAGAFLTVSSTNASASASPAVQLDQLRAQWDAAHQLQLDRQEQRHKTEMAAVQARCRDLEENNRRLTAALARRREQLRLTREAALQGPVKPVDEKSAVDKATTADTTATAAAPRQAAAAQHSPGQRPAGAVVAVAAATQEAMERIVRELHRLETDRAALVEGSSGALRESDAVIVRMDARMRELQAQLTVLRGGDA